MDELGWIGFFCLLRVRFWGFDFSNIREKRREIRRNEKEEGRFQWNKPFNERVCVYLASMARWVNESDQPQIFSDLIGFEQKAWFKRNEVEIVLVEMYMVIWSYKSQNDLWRVESFKMAFGGRVF